MKIPLRFQLTRYDCGTTSVLNALSVLFEREEIKADLIHGVFEFTLDKYGDDGRLGDGGTSAAAMALLVGFINEYAAHSDFPISAKHYQGGDVTEKLLAKSVGGHSVAVASVWLGVLHYVLITKTEGDKVYLFDPYYVDAEQYDHDDAVGMAFDQPKLYNRIVSINRILATNKKDYALGSVDDRELVVIARKGEKNKW